MMTNLDELREKAAKVAAAREETKKMFERERATKIWFLGELAKAVRPALPGISSRVPRREEGKATEYGRGPTIFFDEGVFARGVLLQSSTRGNGDPVPRPVPRKGVDGLELLKGEVLYLSEEGHFFEVYFEGMLRLLKSSDEYWWTGTPRGLILSEVVDEGWWIGDLVGRLSKLLESQAIGHQKAMARAEKIESRVREAAWILEGIR